MDGYILVLVLAFAVSAASAKNPWFCKRYDCPGFDSRSMGDYDVRTYEASNWVATKSVSSSSSGNTRGMFGKLFSYIQGANANGQKIAMTVPVLTKIEKKATSYEYTMMFYLPGANPPAPTDSSVFLVNRPAGPVFVKSFPSWWWVKEDEYWSQWGKLKAAIGDSSQFNANIFFKAGYNSPYDFFSRKQHEVWVDRTGNPVM